MNRLSSETSLYLRQHADNPVQWHPWSDSALTLAREQDRPILLSIGYSACHWCHVMAHESFEDEATAEVMNRLFVNIKVDREERPDLDRVYQLSHQLLTGRGGGWPLTVFLEPHELVPFFAGTYFPRQRRYGMASFVEVLEAVSGWYRDKRDEVAAQNTRLLESIHAINTPATGSLPTADEARGLAAEAVNQLARRFDAEHGGFGGAPKFPQAPLLAAAAYVAESLQHAGLAGQVDFTLKKMAASGLRDHLDGGFFRYCVDATWTIPHFEKMLYDNAQLLPLYAAADDDTMARVAEGMVAWLDRDMRQANGGYSASIDADADGEEGGFHVWTPDQLSDVLDEESAADFIAAMSLDSTPNFEGEAWHLVAGERLADLLTPGSALAASAERLREVRETRVHPTLDPKQITSWNALLASGLIRAADALQREDWLDRAEGILDFIEKESWRDGCLLAVHAEGASRFAAYLDDHACTLSALLDLLQVRFSARRLDWACTLADRLLAQFQDDAKGGFYFTDQDSESPMGRSLGFHDDAMPSGNATAADALLRLGGLVGAPRYHEAAERTLGRGMESLRHSPLAAASLLPALLRAAGGSSQVLLCGHDLAAQLETRSWLREHYQVDCYVIGAPDDRLPGTLGALDTPDGWTAWLCRGTRCLPPVGSREQLARLLERDG